MTPVKYAICDSSQKHQAQPPYSTGISKFLEDFLSWQKFINFVTFVNSPLKNKTKLLITEQAPKSMIS